MIDIDYSRNAELYTDYESCLSLLRVLKESDYSYPVEKTNFHLYTEVKNEKELLAVKSFFATQDQDHTKLILWSDYDIRDNALLAPFADQIDFRVYDPIKEAKGTILDGHDKHLLSEDSKHYLKSGVLRFLATHKYGGIWFDMDMVLLRDLKPILDQEFAYMWGSETDFAGFGPCAAFMGIQKNSKHSIVCLEELINSEIVPDTVCFDHQMLAKVYSRRPFTVFPSVFFNTEWQINKKSPGLGTSIETGWFYKNEHSHHLFLEAFAWHWHNSSHKNKDTETGSKMDLIEKVMDEKLKQKRY